MTRSFNLAQRLYLDDDGSLCEIVSMFDSEGFETDEPEACETFVVKRSENEWFVDDVNETLAAAQGN